MPFAFNITPIEQSKPTYSEFAASSFSTTKRHPQEMGVPEIAACLTHLAVTENVANQIFRMPQLLFAGEIHKPILLTLDPALRYPR
jgi:hypothetical protein